MEDDVHRGGKLQPLVLTEAEARLAQVARHHRYPIQTNMCVQSAYASRWYVYAYKLRVNVLV